MNQKDKDLEKEIRQRAILGLPLQFGIIPPDAIELCQNDRSYLLAALDRERDAVTQLKNAIQNYWSKMLERGDRECTPQEYELYESLTTYRDFGRPTLDGSVLFTYPCFQCAAPIEVKQIFCGSKCKEEFEKGKKDE